MDLKETTDTNLKETQSTDSKRNSNNGLKRKTTDTKKDQQWAYGARDRRHSGVTTGAPASMRKTAVARHGGGRRPQRR